MTDNIHSFKTNFAFENDLDEATATRLVEWLENEGVLDYDIINETYSEPTIKVANDAV